jgi:hypothetical protein
MGEIFANLPSSKTPWPRPIFYGMGLVACMILVRGARLLLRSKDLLPLALYFLTYTLLMCIWAVL